ncbi:hypothetical protein [Rhodomicrobium sp. R_RK_3]|nr:hypothetical protein [Rhodomicrobium sp. R_RK_3]
MNHGVYFFAVIMAMLPMAAASASENYIVSDPASAYARPSKQSASDHSFAAGQVVSVTFCRKSWCQTENEMSWLEAAAVKRVKGMPGAVNVPGFGSIPQAMFEQARRNCEPDSPPDPAGCLCQDGAVIGACGD